MTRLILVALLFAACWRSSPAPAPAEPVVATSSPPPPPPPDAPPSIPFEAAMQKLERFADQMCECHDAQCATEVADGLRRWSEEREKRGDQPPKATEEDMRRAGALGERMGRCMQDAMANGSATP